MSKRLPHEQIKQIIATQLRVPLEEVKPEALLLSDLGADSLDMIELVMEFEDVLKVETNYDDAEKLSTVAEVIAFVDRLTA